MKRLLIILVVMGYVGSIQAQQKPSPSLSDRAISTSIAVAKDLWARVQKEGKPLAERMLKSAPNYYKGAQSQLQALVKRVDKSDIPKEFSEKQRLALELWKLRGAIDVMALSDPLVVKSLLNFRPEAVQKMQKDLAQTETKLKKANLPGI
jgi:Skp family chaperone for outer membrane proteins